MIICKDELRQPATGEEQFPWGICPTLDMIDIFQFIDRPNAEQSMCRRQGWEDDDDYSGTRWAQP